MMILRHMDWNKVEGGEERKRQEGEKGRGKGG